MRRRAEPPRRRHGGFTFLGLMFLIVLMGLMATAAASTWHFTGQRERETQLLFAGREYRAAIGRYAAAHATAPQPFPSELAQLLGDDKALVPVRFLRRLYFDPMTGRPDWGLVRNAQGGITAVFSLSEERPVRTRPPADDEPGVDFVRAKTYRDWVFAARATAAAPPSGTDGPGVGGAIPGWNYARDGEPPLTWGNAPAVAPAAPTD